uniref:MFS-type transporter SLC18B1-like n=1 Tax=Styela clava TaxID=7725 RepID=UPI00193AC948|nr:MFS-type transporter SLC18B1-like [Styela clava]
MRGDEWTNQNSQSHSYDSACTTNTHANDDVIFPNGSIPRTNSRMRQYNTFENSISNSEAMRSRSYSLPYMTCNPRTSRSLSFFEGQGNSKENDKWRDNSLSRNQNKSGDYSDVEFSGSTEVDNEEDIEITNSRWCGFSKRQLKCLFALSILSISDTMGFSIVAPFFPVVAEEKNLSPIDIGLVFSAFSMAGIFGSFLTGALLVRVGAKFVILAGMLWSAGATICFGLLIYAPPNTFFYLCLLCRVMMGIGNAAAFTALFAIIFQEFADRALTVIGISESLCSIGGIVGPLIGGSLFDAGGYLVPFVFLGTLQFFVLLCCAILIPPVSVERHANAVSPAWLLLNPHGLFSALFVMLSFTVNSFLIANISLFLTHSFHISTFMVGVYMLVMSVFYGISTPIWGYFAETRKIGPHMMAVSCFLFGIVLSLYGPADFWRDLFGWTGPEQWLVYICAASSGVVLGGLVIPTFGEMVVAAKQMKLHDNELAEYGLVSGLWNTMFSVGDILGPSVGGVMVVKLNFENSCAILGLLMCVLALAKGVHLAVIAFKRKNSPPESDSDENSSDEDQSDERKSLLSPENPSLQA